MAVIFTAGSIKQEKKCSGVRREMYERELWQELRNAMHKTAQVGSRGLNGGGEARRVEHWRKGTRHEDSYNNPGEKRL